MPISVPNPVSQAQPLLALNAQGSGSVSSATIQNRYSGGLMIYINVTAISGTSPTLAVAIQGVDQYSGNVVTLATAPSVTATGTTFYQIVPGATAASNTSGLSLPQQWRLLATVGGTTPSVTATISAEMLDI